MTKFLIPHKHGPHRIAAIGLYRALLRSTTNSTLDRPAQDSLTELVRHRFRRNRLNTSHRLLVPLYDQAYRILDLLDLSRRRRHGQGQGQGQEATATTPPPAPAPPATPPSSCPFETDTDTGPDLTATTSAALADLHAYLSSPKQAQLLARLRAERSPEHKARLAAEAERKRREAPHFPDPGAGIRRRTLPLELLRPRQAEEESQDVGLGEEGHGWEGEGVNHIDDHAGDEVDGTAAAGEEARKVVTATRRRPRRRVPVLISAGKIPVLRFGKPQPKSLSLYLKDRIRRRQARTDRVAYLSRMMEMARAEDVWDEMLERDWGVTTTKVDDERSPSSGGSSKEEEEEEGWTPRQGREVEGERTSWVKEASRARDEVQGLLNREMTRNVVTAKWYADVVRREKEAAERERKERVMERNRRRRERKAARGG